MFFELARILRAKQPRYFVFENVKGLLNHNNGRTFATIITTLDELGYDCQWQLLNSKNHGVPQNRERVFIVGHFRGETRPQVFPLVGANQEIDGKLVSSTAVDANYWKGIDNHGQRTAIVHKLFDLKASGSKTRRGLVSENGYAKTLDHQCLQGIEIDDAVRKLTPLECERLQGFPDGWTEGVSDTQRYKTIGNAVTVNVIEDIFTEIFK